MRPHLRNAHTRFRRPYIILTPCNHTGLQSVTSHVRSQYFDKCQILKERLHQHPHKGRKYEVMETNGHQDADHVIMGLTYTDEKNNP